MAPRRQEGGGHPRGVRHLRRPLLPGARRAHRDARGPARGSDAREAPPAPPRRPNGTARRSAAPALELSATGAVPVITGAAIGRRDGRGTRRAVARGTTARPRDRFDDVPADLARVGAHRAPARRGRGFVTFAWAALATGALVGAGVLGLSRHREGRLRDRGHARARSSDVASRGAGRDRRPERDRRRAERDDDRRARRERGGDREGATAGRSPRPRTPAPRT